MDPKAVNVYSFTVTFPTFIVLGLKVGSNVIISNAIIGLDFCKTWLLFYKKFYESNKKKTI